MEEVAERVERRSRRDGPQVPGLPREERKEVRRPAVETFLFEGATPHGQDGRLARAPGVRRAQVHEVAYIGPGEERVGVREVILGAVGSRRRLGVGSRRRRGVV